MKLGAFYNFFDGEELIVKSIESIRKNVDYITIAFQQTSNQGNPCRPSIFKLLRQLKDDKLIDSYFTHEPDQWDNSASNETKKRTAGLKNCLEKGCSHVLAIDADEFYLEEEFEYAKKKMEQRDYDATACQMLTYFKEPIYRINPPEEYFVPFIQKIDENSRYILNYPYPVKVDPARRTNGPRARFRRFARNEIQMHHMSWVRKDIRSKMLNSSARCNFRNVEGYVKFFEEWKPGVKDFHPVIPHEFKDVEVVENLFGIDIHQ